MPDEPEWSYDDYEPDLPPNLNAHLDGRAQVYRAYYRGLGQACGANADPPFTDPEITLAHVNTARAAADAERDSMAAAGYNFGDSDPDMGTMPATLLPDTSSTGQPLPQGYPRYYGDADPQPFNPPDNKDPYFPQRLAAMENMRAFADSLTRLRLLWQMYGIALALALNRASTFGKHGGRPTGT